MRFLLSSLLGCALLTGYLVDDPSRFSRAVDATGKFSSRMWNTAVYGRDITLTGNVILKKQSISDLLPHQESNLWWRLNLGRIESALRASPLVEKVEVAPCSIISLRCYEIALTERKASFIAVVRDESKAWIIGNDGAFIAPLTNKQFRAGALDVFGPDSDSLVLVRGLWGEKSSPDEVRARLVHIANAIATLKSGVKLKVEQLTLKDNGEVDVRFQSLGFPVSFDLASDDFADKTERLSRVLAEFNGDYSRIEGVDFTFKKMAVLKMKPEEAKPSAKGVDKSVTIKKS